MQSRWSDDEAREAARKYVAASPGRCNEDLALRVYSSRLIGREPTLVLHGGGNTSVKTRLSDDLDAQVDVLCMKGSGRDLELIEPTAFAALRLSEVQALQRVDSLGDDEIGGALRNRLLDARAPDPSVETLLHAFLPHKYVDHSHADAILALVDQPDAAALCEEVFGESLAVVPYVMSGFGLASLAAQVREEHPRAVGLLLLQHGLVTYGDTARESYERHVAAVTRAEKYIARRSTAPSPARLPDLDLPYAKLAPILRGGLGAGERRYVLTLRTSEATRAFVDDPRLAQLAMRGPATPDHVIRTKRLPLVLDVGGRDGDDLAGYVETSLEEFRGRYGDYVAAQAKARGRDTAALDPDPRVLLIPGLGLIGVGRTKRDASIVADLYEHTIDVIRGAEAVGEYRALPESDIFDMEYWSLEQAKVRELAARPLESNVVYVTGAASGIGAATARIFAQAGAHLYLVDRDEENLQRVASELGCPHEALDVGDREAVTHSIERAIEEFGGLDGVVSNAGYAPQAPIDECPPEVLESSFAVNFFAHQWVASAATRVLRSQNMGGFLLFNASKAAFNPGAGFGPYALPKAALVALVKQYALEGGSAGIRVNAINADRIRTALLSLPDVEARAQARGLDADAYFRSNLLGREVTSEDVAEAFLALALARSTTCAVLTVDGGNLAASPR
jgi:rhamnose utilization protein RhaD (predicted bifunctional aldolase and dehydrogenase)/NAD(P)-dependent dehydrogenase (short-subunit alcohol dehydrogenase family)